VARPGFSGSDVTSLRTRAWTDAASAAKSVSMVASSHTPDPATVALPPAPAGRLPGTPDRRAAGQLLLAAALGAGLSGLGASPAGAQWRMPGLGARERDPFQELSSEFGAIPPASQSTFATRLPDGRTLQVRAHIPTGVEDRMPLLILFGDAAVPPERYAMLAAPLAGHGYLVLVPICEPDSRDSPAQREQRRSAQARFVLDRILAVRSVLGASIERLDPNRIGAIGHGEGAWSALSMIGWGRGLRPDSTASDGRVSAAIGFMPSATPPATIESQAVSRISGQGLVIGDTSQLPTPPPESGLMGVNLAVESPNFGGLIGRAGRDRAEDARRQRPALSAGLAVAAMFADWVLREDTRMGDALVALDGRTVEGLRAPLGVRQA
jgi:dienelactone hydrolase